MKIDLIFDQDCPNVAGARAQLAEALENCGLARQWHEWRRDNPASPDYARQHASPTILIDGRDIAPTDSIAGAGACRIYRDPSGRASGVPDSRDIRAALLQAKGASSAPKPVKHTLSALPAVGVALLPKLTCAACWPAYAALLSSLGIGFIDYTPYLLPVTVVALTLTLCLLAYRATRRRGYGPLMLGIASASVMLVGKFTLDSDAALYGGIALLVAASVWNVWPRPPTGCSNCSANV